MERGPDDPPHFGFVDARAHQRDRFELDGGRSRVLLEDCEDRVFHFDFVELPSEMNPVDVVVIATIAMVLSLGATLLPSRQGSRVDPVEGLRHE